MVHELQRNNTIYSWFCCWARGKNPDDNRPIAASSSPAPARHPIIDVFRGVDANIWWTGGERAVLTERFVAIVEGLRSRESHYWSHFLIPFRVAPSPFSVALFAHPRRLLNAPESGVLHSWIFLRPSPHQSESISIANCGRRKFVTLIIIAKLRQDACMCVCTCESRIVWHLKILWFLILRPSLDKSRTWTKLLCNFSDFLLFSPHNHIFYAITVNQAKSDKATSFADKNDTLSAFSTTGRSKSTPENQKQPKNNHTLIEGWNMVFRRSFALADHPVDKKITPIFTLQNPIPTTKKQWHVDGGLKYHFSTLGDLTRKPPFKFAQNNQKIPPVELRFFVARCRARRPPCR